MRKINFPYTESQNRSSVKKGSKLIFDGDKLYYFKCNQKVQEYNFYCLSQIRRNIEIGHAKESHLNEVVSENIRGRWKRALKEPKANLRTGKYCFITSVFSNMADGKTYFFNNSYFWRLSSSYKADVGYPRNVTQKWKDLPETFDEVFLWGANWKTYFFKVFICIVKQLWKLGQIKISSTQFVLALALSNDELYVF